jgi:transposase
MTSPLLPHARALLASPSTLTVAELDEALGVAQSVHSLRLTAAVAMARDAMPLLASLCTALEASEAEAGRLREERESFGQSIDMLIVARDEAAKRIEAERDKLRALLAEACDIGERIERDSGNWRPTDRTRLATIRTEALK